MRRNHAISAISANPRSSCPMSTRMRPMGEHFAPDGRATSHVPPAGAVVHTARRSSRLPPQGVTT
eukprot:5036847-Prymnesium_polylepis.1